MTYSFSNGYLVGLVEFFLSSAGVCGVVVAVVGKNVVGVAGAAAAAVVAAAGVAVEAGVAAVVAAGAAVDCGAFSSSDRLATACKSNSRAGYSGVPSFFVSAIFIASRLSFMLPHVFAETVFNEAFLTFCKKRASILP